MQSSWAAKCESAGRSTVTMRVDVSAAPNPRTPESAATNSILTSVRRSVPTGLILNAVIDFMPLQQLPVNLSRYAADGCGRTASRWKVEGAMGRQGGERERET